jgi:hypothetical protein
MHHYRECKLAFNSNKYAVENISLSIREPGAFNGGFTSNFINCS